MAVINFARKEIEAKVVYYGPAFSGKTTNVQKLHELMPAGQRGELHSLATEADRTLFFDYVPIQLGKISGFDAKFKLFTVPGQVVYQQTRRVVLQGADAVVFVADSSPDRIDANLDSLVDLEENLRAHGMDLTSIPLVLQLNKRDAPGARSAQDMLMELNPFGVPWVEAVAANGDGVLETLKRVTEIAAQRIKENLAGQKTAVKVVAVDRAEAEDDRRVIREHIERIRKVRPEETAKEQQMHAAGRLHVQSVDAFKPQGAAKPLIKDPIKDPIREQGRDVQGRDVQGAATQMIGSQLGAGSGSAGNSSVYEVSRPIPRQQPPAQRVIPPPPAPPKAEWPPGGPLEAWLEGEPNVRAIEAIGATLGADGHIRVDVVMDRGGGPMRHTVTLASRQAKAVKPAERAAERPAEGGSWVGAGVAGILGVGVGAVLGIALGWAVFAGG